MTLSGLATLALAGALATGSSATDEVIPGSVVRWQGAGSERCALGTRSWAPTGDACLYGIDLLAKGSLTLARTRRGRSESAVVRVGAYPYGEQRLHVPSGLVRLSKADLARVARELRQIAPLWWHESDARFTLPLATPLAELPTGSNFGVRRFFNGEPRSPHSGSDYSAPQGTPVLAVDAGAVALVANHFFGGNSVFIDHGGGLLTMYFHLVRVDVQSGAVVTRGQPIGLVGATGRAAGPHLHFGARFHGARVGPQYLLGAPEALPEIRR